jgi:hypothetical protein
MECRGLFGYRAPLKSRRMFQLRVIIYWVIVFWNESTFHCSHTSGTFNSLYAFCWNLMCLNPDVEVRAAPTLTRHLGADRGAIGMRYEKRADCVKDDGPANRVQFHPSIGP